MAKKPAKKKKPKPKDAQADAERAQPDKKKYPEKGSAEHMSLCEGVDRGWQNKIWTDD